MNSSTPLYIFQVSIQNQTVWIGAATIAGAIKIAEGYIRTHRITADVTTIDRMGMLQL